MFSVLIVDDEPTIREGLRTLLPWEELGYEVVDTASNGKDALRKHELHRPDLMIVDIRMPGMDGLELIEALREVDKSLHILILSGYADFDYAKKAILGRVDGYLLKPVDEDELEDYLRKLKTTLQEERTRLRQAGRWEEASKEQRILSALRGSMDPAEEGFGWPSYELALVKTLSREDIDPIVAAAIRREWSDALESNGKGVLFTVEPYAGLLLKNDLADPEARASLLRTLREPCLARGLDCDVVSGGKASRWTELEALYERALDLMKDRFFYDAETIKRYGDDASETQRLDGERRGEADAGVTGALEEKLYLAVDIGNPDTVSQLIDEAGRLMREACLPEHTIKTRFVQIAGSVVARLAAHRPELQTVDRRLSVDMLSLFREYRYDDLLRATKSLFRGLLSATEEPGADKLVKRVVDLIQRNYHENLKLETIAELFHYNSAYLGKVFKQATGEYFNTYLDKVRIEQAKALLEQGMKVYQVAEQVGYANVDYFHTKFKKYVGTSPSSYRKKE